VAQARLSPQLRSAALLVVGAYGSTPPRLPSFRAAMGALAQEPTTSTVRLEPLGREDVASFVRQASGRSVSEASIEKVFEKARVQDEDCEALAVGEAWLRGEAGGDGEDRGSGGGNLARRCVRWLRALGKPLPSAPLGDLRQLRIRPGTPRGREEEPATAKAHPVSALARGRLG